MTEAERVRALDEYLLQLRGYVSRYPDNGKVIVLFSGGLDSVVLAARLIINHGLTVFPVHIVRGQSNLQGEERSIAHYQREYSARFGDKFQAVQSLHVSVPPPEIKAALTEYVPLHGYPCRDNLFCLFALYYAVAMRSQYGPIMTILTSAIPGGTYTHDTLSALRATTVLACNSTPDQDWVISAPNLDPLLSEGAQQVTKSDLVSWGHSHRIDMQYTHTCIMRGDMHCGQCIFCGKRRHAFALANVTDNTRYAHD